MHNPQPNIFIQKRRNSNARKLFVKVVGYFTYCYQKIIDDKTTYSESYVNQKTSYKLEDYLKTRFVLDYLRKRNNKLSYQKLLSQKLNRQFNGIENLHFHSEPEEEFIQDGIEKRDKIDIHVTNLGLVDNWNDVDNENLYFAFECKRLLNTKKSNDYLSDTIKFTTRNYSSFRFPFNGMLGFVENSSISIREIIDDLENRLVNHATINSVKYSGKIWHPFEIENFEYCRLSKHRHDSSNTCIEIFHLFLDYSEIIVQ
jgi:hypothetical protein